MNKSVVGIINADVQAIAISAGFKKHQISGQQLISIDFTADLGLCFGSPQLQDVETIAESKVNETRTV